MHHFFNCCSLLVNPKVDMRIIGGRCWCVLDYMWNRNDPSVGLVRTNLIVCLHTDTKILQYKKCIVVFVCMSTTACSVSKIQTHPQPCSMILCQWPHASFQVEHTSWCTRGCIQSCCMPLFHSLPLLISPYKVKGYSANSLAHTWGLVIL